jgi:hypothetical protein
VNESITSEDKVAKARIVTPDGTQVNLDGTPAEIAAVLMELKVAAGASRKSVGAASAKPQRKTSRATVPGLLDELIDAKFFTKPKGMGEIQDRLADLGHHYPLTSLSGPLQSHVRARKLRRFKKDRKYVYAQ